MQALHGAWFLGQIPDPSLAGRGETEHEMVSNAFFFNCMGTDGAQGKFSLDTFGNLALSFTGGKLANHPVFKKIEDILKAMAQAMGGQYVPFPLWGGLIPDRKVITVHPLGGCPIGNSSTDGVVDTKGRVFNTRSGASTVHQNLYVMDASIIPGPLAVNPTLTIVALALKIVEGIN
jgi:cholesterol oxidase